MISKQRSGHLGSQEISGSEYLIGEQSLRVKTGELEKKGIRPLLAQHNINLKDQHRDASNFSLSLYLRRCGNPPRQDPGTWHLINPLLCFTYILYHALSLS